MTNEVLDAWARLHAMLRRLDSQESEDSVSSGFCAHEAERLRRARRAYRRGERWMSEYPGLPVRARRIMAAPRRLRRTR